MMSCYSLNILKSSRLFTVFLLILCYSRMVFTARYTYVRSAVVRGVRNQMKISDIGFLKTEPNRTDLKI